MKPNDIQASRTYKGGDGIQREVVSVNDFEVVYRNGEGRLVHASRERFAAWAVEKV